MLKIRRLITETVIVMSNVYPLDIRSAKVVGGWEKHLTDRPFAVFAGVLGV